LTATARWTWTTHLGPPSKFLVQVHAAVALKVHDHDHDHDRSTATTGPGCYCGGADAEGAAEFGAAREIVGVFIRSRDRGATGNLFCLAEGAGDGAADSSVPQTQDGATKHPTATTNNTTGAPRTMPLA
jgi:hypothetical protein